jgi:hypothetical protein
VLAELSKRRADIAMRTEDGRTYAIERLGSQLRSAEAQVHYLDRLIGRREHRVADHLNERA